MYFKKRFLIIPSIIILLLVLMIAQVQALGKESGSIFKELLQQDTHENKHLENIKVVDCTQEFDESAPHRLVLQIINNTFYKWREHDIGEDGRFCIFLEEPEQRALTAGEARDLLIASQGWRQQLQKIAPDNNVVTVDPKSLPDLKGLTPFIKEPRLDWNDDYISDAPDTAISRPEHTNKKRQLRSSFQTTKELALQSIFSGDNRERVPYSLCTSYPANTIGYVEVYFGFGKGRGTGFLISPYTILTNAHILYNSTYGGWFHQLSFYPGQYQDHQSGLIYRPYGERAAVAAFAPQSYIDYEYSNTWNNPYDYGAFFIDKPFSKISTFMPLEFDFHPLYINLAGYPSEVQGEFNSMTMWHSFGQVVNIRPRELDHLADVSPGNSGSPVWVYNQQADDSRVVGLLAKAGPYYNSGPRLTYHNRDLIEKWMRWKPEAVSIPVTSINFDRNSLFIVRGKTEKLIPTIYPANATNKNITWSSSDPSIVSVKSNGIITALAQGSAIITVKTEDGNKTASCIVTVISPFSVSRISGNNRYTTAIEVSKKGWPGGADTVILARGDEYADALAGVPLAYHLDAPILLTSTDRVIPADLLEIRRLKAKQVILLGGTTAISDAVKHELENIGLSVRRIAGSNRYDTAALIAKNLRKEGSMFHSAFIVVSTNFADALAASPYAAAKGQPILLTSPDQLPAITEHVLQELGVTNTIVCGGEKAVSSRVFTELNHKSLNPIRIFGNERYESATALANSFLPSGTENICLATGLDFPDAVAGGVLAAKYNSGILLVQGDQHKPNFVVQEFLAQGEINEVILFGGSNAISSEIESWF